MDAKSQTEGSREIVNAYYQAGKESRLTDFAPLVADDFTTTAPNYLPWGGTHLGGSFFRDQVLPNLPDVLDFSRFSYDVLLAEGEKVVALIDVGVAGTGDVVKISEHWTVRDGQARSIWVAYFEPQPRPNSPPGPRGGVVRPKCRGRLRPAADLTFAAGSTD
ncbi:MAG TPA: hypothetical protein VHY34_04380 [Caulobacteraceae bacterium]|jgi:ketosteroid isomerase-like protein|nr:hypothetical protein [Caulobacteraceae bacterium]